MANVYRYYDDTGRLLYVGRTRTGIARGYAHESTARWWPAVAFAEFHYVDDFAAALAERLIIWTERPVWNVASRLSTEARQGMLARLAEHPEFLWISPRSASKILAPLTETEVRCAVRWGFIHSDYPRAMHMDHDALRAFIGTEDNVARRRVSSGKRRKGYDDMAVQIVEDKLTRRLFPASPRLSLSTEALR